MIAATRPHIAAVMALLTGAGVEAYLSEAPKTASPRYVVLYPSPGRPVDGSLGGVSSDLDVPFQTTAVGVTADQAMWASDRASQVLEQASPVVAGRVCWVVFDASQPVMRDDSLANPLYYAVARWRLRSVPA